MRGLKSIATVLTIAVGIAGIALVLYAWRLPPFHSASERTNDAYVSGNVTILSPQLAAYVAEVAVTDYQHVKQGDLLIRLDDRIYRHKLEQAKATLASQEAALAGSEQELRTDEANIRMAEAKVSSAQAAATLADAKRRRADSLFDKRVATQSDVDAAKSAAMQAQAATNEAQAAVEVARQQLESTKVNRRTLEAAVAGAEAALHLAEIDLANTRIVAPQDGTLGAVGVSPGAYVTAGSQLTSLVPERKWIVANFKETQIGAMTIGQEAVFTVDALGHRRMTGHVERFSPATGSQFSVIKPDNATGNFVKIAQRVPVRISIDEGQDASDRLAPGMSVVVSIDTAKGEEMAALDKRP